jgi:hypothetical protein
VTSNKKDFVQFIHSALNLSTCCFQGVGHPLRMGGREINTILLSRKQDTKSTTRLVAGKKTSTHRRSRPLGSRRRRKLFQQDGEHWKEVPPEALRQKVRCQFLSTIKEERKKAQSSCSEGNLSVPVKNTAMTRVRATIETISKLEAIEIEGHFHKSKNERKDGIPK